MAAEDNWNPVMVLFRSICGLGWKDLYNSPLWTFRSLWNALNNHDTAEFEHYLCIERFLCKVYDDMREPIISTVKCQLLSAVSGVSGTEEEVNKEQIRQTGRPALFDKMSIVNPLKRMLDYDNIELSKVSTESKSDNAAVIAVVIYNRRLKSSFTLRLLLEPLGKKGWRFIAPLNLKDVLLAMNKTDMCR